MRALSVVVLLALAVAVSACRGVLKPEYEYEEDLYLDLDGSATLFVNASVPALVALRGADLDVNPRARFNRAAIRRMFAGPRVEVRTPTSSRRHGRRFAHVRVDARRVEDLAQVAAFSWSTYEWMDREDVIEFQQIVGPAAGKPVGDVGWTGSERVRFRVHLPSRIPYHNAKSGVQRGNILEWEQPLAERLKGTPLDLQAHMETESILSQTLLLFASTVAAALAALAVVVWWLARKGRSSQVAESRP